MSYIKQKVYSWQKFLGWPWNYIEKIPNTVITWSDWYYCYPRIFSSNSNWTLVTNRWHSSLTERQIHVIFPYQVGVLLMVRFHHTRIVVHADMYNFVWCSQMGDCLKEDSNNFNNWQSLLLEVIKETNALTS